MYRARARRNGYRMFISVYILCYYLTIYIWSNCLFLAMSWVTELFHWSIHLTIDWHYTMAWLPSSLLKTHRCLSTCVTSMPIKEMLCNNGEKKHGLATLNSNNPVVYGKKHIVWVLVFLVKMSQTVWDQNWADLVKFSVKQQNRIVYSNSMQETLIKWVG